MRKLSCLFLIAFLAIHIPSAAEEEYYEIEGVKIKKEKVRIKHESEIKSEKTEQKPAFKEDKFTIDTKKADFTVKYSRFLNSPENFSGTHRSLDTGDMGIGIPAQSPVWYWNSTIRVFINGKDIFARMEASQMHWKEGYDFARIRFVWDAPDAGVALNIAVPYDAEAVCLEVEIEPKGKIDSFSIELRCYPGAYTAPWNFPSHRWIKTPVNSVEVKKNEENRKLEFTPVDGWIFYADKYHDYEKGRGHGSGGLVFLPDEKAEGEVDVSWYGVRTMLNYPVDCRKAHLALYTFKTANRLALEKLKDGFGKQRETLGKIVFWQ